METVLFLAILTFCPIGQNCYGAEGFTRHISEPFAVAHEDLTQGLMGDVHSTCQEQLNMLEELYPSEGSASHLCVRKDVWERKHTPDNVIIEPLDEPVE